MIYAFKTSIRTEKDIEIIKPLLNKLLPLGKWNFDIEDCDNIFRVDTLIENSEVVIKLLKDNGFDCEELAD
tara:strand:+ start:29168 stop:29380 length:213 start_codon:yes stop_codon:yes gene_type:complete